MTDRPYPPALSRRQLEGNILAPLIYRRTVDVNPLVTLLESELSLRREVAEGLRS